MKVSDVVEVDVLMGLTLEEAIILCAQLALLPQPGPSTPYREALLAQIERVEHSLGIN